MVGVATHRAKADENLRYVVTGRSVLMDGTAAEDIYEGDYLGVDEYNGKLRHVQTTKDGWEFVQKMTDGPRVWKIEPIDERPLAERIIGGTPVETPEGVIGYCTKTRTQADGTVIVDVLLTNPDEIESAARQVIDEAND
jgi:hypothetical protein